MSKKIVIAIDGHSSCGKSTIARALAKKLSYIYVDSGAMYRAVTLFFLQNNIDLGDDNSIARALKNIDISFAFNPELGVSETYMNGRNVERLIRGVEVSNMVSVVSRIKDVRKALVEYQRLLGAKKGIVMDGRDIGTVVFPDADLKLFVTADIDTRVERRYKELHHKGVDISKEEVRENLVYRDHIDSTRRESPLRQADDAVVMDTTHLTHQEQLQRAFELANARINS